jgi:hypothetical protein
MERGAFKKVFSINTAVFFLFFLQKINKGHLPLRQIQIGFINHKKSLRKNLHHLTPKLFDEVWKKSSSYNAEVI